jgi:hypothetical protein
MQRFIGLYGNGAHHAAKRMHPPRGTDADLEWWRARLDAGPISRALSGPPVLRDVRAFSDASSGVGISVFIDGWWRAWRLVPGWKRDGRDIQWAEAVGFAFLCRYALRDAPAGTNVIAWGDNRCVVEGWWRGRAGNTPVNEVFKVLGSFLDRIGCDITTRYVASASNPADGPSRGIYGPGTPCPYSRLLPPIPLPDELSGFVVDFDAPEPDAERRARADFSHQPRGKIIDSAERARRESAHRSAFEAEPIGDPDRGDAW